MALVRACAILLASMWVWACVDGSGRHAPRRVVQAVPALSVTSAEHADSTAAAFDPFAFDPVSFSRKAKPRPGEWLDRFREPEQTFEQFVAESTIRATPLHDRIVIQPLGDIPATYRATLEKLRAVVQAFFQLPVEFAEPWPLAASGARKRRILGNPERQYFTQALMSDLAAHRPARALAYIGVTLEDLYPDPKWNFVFGEADPDRRVAVYSLKRFQPSFSGVRDTPAARQQALRRSIQLISHETGHVFGLLHCTKNECVMNGSNSLEESDSQPLHLFPVCLHKLRHALKFDVGRRYRDLLSFYSTEHFDGESEWLRVRLSRLGEPIEAP